MRIKWPILAIKYVEIFRRYIREMTSRVFDFKIACYVMRIRKLKALLLFKKIVDLDYVK